ncbi:hypothetical protein D3C86_1731200 [compost metagenome]
MPDGLRSFDPDEAGSLLSLPDVERSAFAGLDRQLPQHRLHHFLNVEGGLVARAQPPGCAAEPPVAVFLLHQIVVRRQRARQPQHGGLVDAGPPAQFGK